MRKLLFALLFVTLAAHADDSPLVKAAKASGGPKKKSSRKVITNADVKKSAGKIQELPGSKATITLTTEPEKKKPATVADAEEQRRVIAAADKRVSAAEVKVARLESDLARIEQSYYESDDPSYRDTTIKQRFDQTKKQLEDARKDLADARDEQKRVTPPPPQPAKTQ